MAHGWRQKPPPVCRYGSVVHSATHHVTARAGAPTWRNAPLPASQDCTPEILPAFGAYVCADHLDRALAATRNHPRRTVKLLTTTGVLF